MLLTSHGLLADVRCKLKKKPTAQIAHLVFANAQSQNTKNQKSNFLPTLYIPLAEKYVLCGLKKIEQNK